MRRLSDAKDVRLPRPASLFPASSYGAGYLMNNWAKLRMKTEGAMKTLIQDSQHDNGDRNPL
jgi:hypothetical protein